MPLPCASARAGGLLRTLALAGRDAHMPCFVPQTSTSLSWPCVGTLWLNVFLELQLYMWALCTYLCKHP